MEPLLEPLAGNVTRMRDALNELHRIAAQPDLWTAGEPPRIVRTLLDALSTIATDVEEGISRLRS